MLRVSFKGPPLIFFLLLIAFGVVLFVAGRRRWSYFLESGLFPKILRSLFDLSSGETDDYMAGFCMLGGIICIITGVLGLIIFQN